MNKGLALVPVLLALAACQTAPPPRREAYDLGPRPIPSEQSAPIHAAPPPGEQRIPVIASAGPLKEAMIEKYMDNQEGGLRSALRGSGILVTRRGDDIILQAPNAALFSGGMQLSDNGQRALWAIAPVLRRYDHSAVSISGYTDTTGSDDQNMAVSRKRAYTVGGELVKYGVPLSRLHAEGFGKQDLKVQTGDNVSEPRNRRIEIRITPQAAG